MMRGLFSRRAALAATVEYPLLLALVAAAPAAYAAEVKVMSTVALTPTLDELTPKYESSSGNKLTIIYSTIADLKKRIDAGETADLMILSRPVLDDLQTQGKVAQGSIVNVGRSYVAIGVQAGRVSHAQRDFILAKQLYEKAASLKYAASYLNLGGLFYAGSGVPKDYEAARSWYEKAAAANDPAAMNAIGNLYEQGNGVPKDYAQARIW
jgi:molybdate transport system substrate-binding protein